MAPASPHSDLRFTPEHCWVSLDGDIATVGLTEHGQDEMGEIAYVELPEPESDLAENQACAVIEVDGDTTEIGIPLSGKVVEINELLLDDPGLVNRSPEDEGWLVRIELTDPDSFEQLMDEQAYADLLDTL